MMDGNYTRHDVIYLPALQLSFAVSKDQLTGSVDLIHDSTVLSIEFEEDNTMFLIKRSFVPCCDLLLLAILSLYLACLLQDVYALLLIIEHLDQIPRIEVVALYAP
jgi:hypothetical protein